MKLIDCNYDKETGESVVRIEHMKKIFVGTAMVHPDDKEQASSYAGCSFAETRAIIAALKYERRKKIQKCEECRKYLKACEQYKDFDKSSPTARCMYRQLNRRIKQVDNLSEEINELIMSLKASIIKRDLVLKAIAERKSKKDNS